MIRLGAMLVGGIRREKSRFLVIFYFFLFTFSVLVPGLGVLVPQLE